MGRLDPRQPSARADALSARDERFRLFYECSPLAYQSLDGDGCIVDINPAWLDLLGYRHEQVLGRSFGDFMTPECRQVFGERFSRFKRIGKVMGAQWEVTDRDGRVICIELDGRASYDQDGNFVRSHCVLRDITERKQAEQTTHALAQAAVDLLDLAPDADLFQFIAGRAQTFVGRGIVSVNSIEADTLTVRAVSGALNATLEAAEKLLGRSIINMPFDGVHERARRDLMTGRLVEVEGGLYELFFRTVPQPICHALEKATGLTRCYSIGMRHGDNLLGNVTVLSQNGAVLNSGMIEAFVNQASIALERRRALEALSQSEEKHRLLLTHSPVGIGYFDMAGRINMLNQLAAGHMGGQPESFVGKSLEQLHGTERGSLYLGRIRDVAKRRISHTYVDRVELPTGEKWFRSIYAPLTAADGHVLGVQIISDDITQLKRAEQELQAAHHFLQTVLDSFPGNVAVLAADGTIAMFNDAWRAFGLANGLAPEWLERGVNYLEICRRVAGLWSDEATQVASAVEAILHEQSDSFETEYPCHSPDEQRWFHLQAQGFTYNHARWVVLAHVDITMRVKAEQAWRDSERKFRVVTETIQDVFWMSTPGVAEQLYVSPAYESVWGRSREEFQANPLAFVEAVHPADYDRVRTCMKTYHGQGRQYRCEYRIVRPDGQVRWILERGFPVQEDGACRLMAGVCTDITERKEAEEAFVQSQAQFQALFERMPSGVAVYETIDNGADFVFKDLNASAEKIEGIRKEDVIGRRVTEVFPGVKEFGVFAAFQRVWKTGTPEFLPAAVYQDDNRPASWRESWVYKLPSGDVVTVYNDVTQRQAAEERLQRYQQQLRSLASELALAGERERRRIGLGLHDHVGQSLAMTKLAVQSLTEQVDAKTTDALTRISDQIDKQIEVIRSLSFELGGSVLYEVGLKEAVEDYLQREIRGKHGIACRLEAQEGFSELPDDAKIVLFRNLRELLNNVIKHAQARRVEIVLTASNECYTVTVRDDGVGFTPADDPGSHEREHYGLFSVREQLGLFGGQVDIGSAPGEGTVATMTLPRKSPNMTIGKRI